MPASVSCTLWHSSICRVVHAWAAMPAARCSSRQPACQRYLVSTLPTDGLNMGAHFAVPCPAGCRWEASAKAIRNVDFSPAHNDGVLFSCDEAGACKLWSADSGAEVAQLQPPPGQQPGVPREGAELGLTAPAAVPAACLRLPACCLPASCPPILFPTCRRCLAADMPRATFFRCKSAVDEQGIVLYTPMKWKREGWVVKWRQVGAWAFVVWNAPHSVLLETLSGHAGEEAGNLPVSCSSGASHPICLFMRCCPHAAAVRAAACYL
jgi:hypothetical protein